MPIFRKKIVKLHRKERRARISQIIPAKKPLGSGWEGQVREVKVKVIKRTRKGNIKERTVTLAEKEFFSGEETRTENFRRPIAQVRVMNELIEANRKFGLGLRTIPTIRIRYRKGEKPTILMTTIFITKDKDLTPAQRRMFNADKSRQMRILKKIGFEATGEAFARQVDGKGNCTAIIVDAGTIRKK
ncbi:MAG: hypothetical protein Q7K42_02705 [Candidatus Diapherotrites archaeon]|nr:hypothetical protein [Candidatus Diapherotrites archaeon]